MYYNKKYSLHLIDSMLSNNNYIKHKLEYCHQNIQAGNCTVKVIPSLLVSRSTFKLMQKRDKLYKSLCRLDICKSGKCNRIINKPVLFKNHKNQADMDISLLFYFKYYKRLTGCYINFHSNRMYNMNRYSA